MASRPVVPPKTAGVRAGDRLLAIGELSITDPDFGPAFRARFGNQEGAPLPIKVLRGADTLTLNSKVVLAERIQRRVEIDPGSIGEGGEGEERDYERAVDGRREREEGSRCNVTSLVPQSLPAYLPPSPAPPMIPTGGVSLLLAGSRRLDQAYHLAPTNDAAERSEAPTIMVQSAQLGLIAGTNEETPTSPHQVDYP